MTPGGEIRALGPALHKTRQRPPPLLDSIDCFGIAFVEQSSLHFFDIDVKLTKSRLLRLYNIRHVLSIITVLDSVYALSYITISMAFIQKDID